MSTGAMTQRIAESSPRFKARMAGVCQLLEAVTAGFGQVIVLGRLVVADNAAATAANILGHERLFWLGFTSSLIGVAFHIAWGFLLYELLKPVNRSISLLAAFVVLVDCALQAFTSLFHLAPLLILQGGSSLSAFAPEQLQALALMFLKLSAYAFAIDHVFFGFWFVLTGYLIFRSTFLPRVLGVLLAISGLGWVTYLSPPLAQHLSTFVVAASAVGEIPLELWLIVMGVNVQRWKEQASAARASDAASGS
ncbi:MAG TPA: DUF4386 domain-containing protein [Bryobacteraceae bacterium]|nr:DUF4386 domain-containing protein [Bryobacteraceae bacterium]